MTRVEVTVLTRGTVQSADVVAVPLDGADAALLDPASARVFSVDDGGEVLAADVPAQLILDGDRSELLIEWPQLSDPAVEHHFQLYASPAGAASPSTPVAARVQVERGSDEGLLGHAITTDVGRWFLDSDGGGFSSLDDPNGNDWISWNISPRDAGRFRGIPNLAFPENLFHPGSVGVTTTLISDGPLGARFRAVDDAATWAVRYDIHPRRLRITVEQAAHDYWVMYEGTPGGSLQSVQDRVVLADSTMVDGVSSFNHDLAPAEWMAVSDTSNLGSLILGAVGDDTAQDRYSSLGSMTIAGLGRANDTPVLTQIDREYIVALTPTVAVGTLSRRALALINPPERTNLSVTTRS